MDESKTTLKLQLENQALKDIVEDQAKTIALYKNSMTNLEAIATRPVISCLTDNQIDKLAELLLRRMEEIKQSKDYVN